MIQHLPDKHRRRGKRRYTVLLAVLLGLFVLFPFLERTAAGPLLVDLFITFLLLVCIYAVSARRIVFISALILAAFSLIGRWGDYFAHHQALETTALLFNAAFLLLTVGSILTDVLRDERVDGDKISGALCAYILMSLIWASFYTALAIHDPAAFQLGGFGAIAGEGGEKFMIFSYFSLVTISTLGYGDIAPQSSAAAALAGSEAVVGQMYLAVLVARLVGLHIAHAGARRD